MPRKQVVAAPRLEAILRRALDGPLPERARRWFERLLRGDHAASTPPPPYRAADAGTPRQARRRT